MQFAVAFFFAQGKLVDILPRSYTVRGMTAEIYPLAYLHGKFLFPRCQLELPARLNEKKTHQEGEMIVVLPISSPFDLLCARNKVATLATVTRIVEGGSEQVAECKGEKRVIIRSRKGFYNAQLKESELISEDGLEDVVERLRKKAQEFVFLINIPESDRLIYLMNFIHGASDLSDFIAHYFIIDQWKKGKLYRKTDVPARCNLLERYLDGMVSGLERNARRGN